ncbi:hypothetical protein CSUB01_05207 [Colletotrichum sublineola]|uniref:Uncharacterized protein n=1 Tax=Colletotrichum sublineola TaxID=1173701 RepID=A0A066XJA1_COLSU|nr:hypothetical protein CSUB01_05207 [Colletotrichum sublineola]
MTDAELDNDWQPNGRRPQSCVPATGPKADTIARSFSQELADIFRLDDPVTDLDEKLDQRKQIVQSQTSELEALERRIREMEERLKSNGRSIQTSSDQSAPAEAATPALSKEAQEKARSRPGTARQNQPHAPSSANMPPTPTASEGEYEFVGKDDLDDYPPRH